MVVGVLILSGAVNTSMIGANGVLNRVAEDRVLVDWFRKPHPRFGTTYRLIDAITILQLLTIVASRGDVYVLGEAYAFGVVWSFFLKSLGVLVLRFKRHDQEYKHPGNIQIGGREIPVGLIVTTSVLFLVAIANLFSKEIATIYGVSLHRSSVHGLHRFRADQFAEARWAARRVWRSSISICRPRSPRSSIHARPGCILVAVRDYNNLAHLQSILRKTNLRRHDIVV